MASIAHFMTEKKNFQAINSNNELKIYLQQGYHFDYLTKRKKNLIKIIKIENDLKNKYK